LDDAVKLEEYFELSKKEEKIDFATETKKGDSVGDSDDGDSDSDDGDSDDGDSDSDDGDSDDEDDGDDDDGDDEDDGDDDEDDGDDDEDDDDSDSNDDGDGDGDGGRNFLILEASTEDDDEDDADDVENDPLDELSSEEEDVECELERLVFDSWMSDSDGWSDKEEDGDKTKDGDGEDGDEIVVEEAVYTDYRDEEEEEEVQLNEIEKKYHHECLDFLRFKGVYPYSYFDSYSKMKDVKLPDIEKFKNDLSGQDCALSEYERASKIYDHFGLKNLGEYTNLYIASDTLILADLFEEFRHTALQEYSLDPGRFLTAGSLSLAAALKTSEAKLQLLTDPMMHLEFESGLRGTYIICNKLIIIF
jgi:hypothetical protein